MSETNIFTEEERLELFDTQRVRRELIQKLAASGVPEKTSDKVLLLGLLDGSDRSTLSRAKLRADKVKEENTQNILKMVAETLRTANTRAIRPDPVPEERMISSSVPERTFVPGELDIGNEPISISIE